MSPGYRDHPGHIQAMSARNRLIALREMTLANGCTANEAQLSLKKANELRKFVKWLPDRYRLIRLKTSQW